MRRWRKLAVVAALVTGLLVSAIGPASAARSPFTGLWTSVDFDGSNQRLAIGGGTSPRVLLYDDGATACGLDGSGVPMYAARAADRGSISGDTLSVVFDVYCLARPTVFWGLAPVSFEYDPVADTLTDNFGVVWHRR